MPAPRPGHPLTTLAAPKGQLPVDVAPTGGPDIERLRAGDERTFIDLV